ncbi:MAG TPA: hypothetical protein VME43_14815, partial [Bryobacteraceae bacterium]|nr:hypothetical protein [Bryobacteraceae bacterium]
EWDIFWMKTTSGGPLTNNINGNWNITMDYTLTAPAYFDHNFMQWMVNGVAVSPLTNGIGSICCATTSTPLSTMLPGPTYYNTEAVPYPAGLFSNWEELYIDP